MNWWEELSLLDCCHPTLEPSGSFQLAKARHLTYAPCFSRSNYLARTKRTQHNITKEVHVRLLQLASDSSPYLFSARGDYLVPELKPQQCRAHEYGQALSAGSLGSAQTRS